MSKVKEKKAKIIFPNGEELELTLITNPRELIEIAIETNRILARHPEYKEYQSVKFTKSCLEYIERVESWKKRFNK